MKSQFHEEFYSFAKYYDIAFDFKDVAKECSFLKEVFRKHAGRNLESFIEFGAGPALHCVEMAKTLSLVTAVTVKLEYEDGDRKGILQDRSPQRCFTATEFAALVAASGAFEVVEFYGAMDASIPFSNDKKSWRMIPVLRKI